MIGLHLADTDGDWLTVKEASRRARCSRSLLYVLLRRSEIKSFVRKTTLESNQRGARLVSRKGGSRE
jgi:hypothetical protein